MKTADKMLLYLRDIGVKKHLQNQEIASKGYGSSLLFKSFGGVLFFLVVVNATPFVLKHPAVFCVGELKWKT